MGKLRLRKKYVVAQGHHQVARLVWHTQSAGHMEHAFHWEFTRWAPEGTRVLRVWLKGPGLTA